MSEEQIGNNYESLQDHNSRIFHLEKKLEMLDARILKLEAIIVELANVDEEEAFDEKMDWADQAQMVRDNEEKEE